MINVPLIGGPRDGDVVRIEAPCPVVGVPTYHEDGIGRAYYDAAWFQVVMLDVVWSYLVYTFGGGSLDGRFAPGNTFVVRHLIENRDTSSCEFADVTIFPR